MAAACFCKTNAILDSHITVNVLELSSWQGDGITYSVDKNSKELVLLDTKDWFSKKYEKFDPWWLRSDTATHDEELDKGIYTGHFSWNNQIIPVDKKHDGHAKIFEFKKPYILSPAARPTTYAIAQRANLPTFGKILNNINIPKINGIK